jgi:hypothetical protein
LHDKLAAEPGFTCPFVPESNILCFRVGGVDQFELRERLLVNGRLHIGSTTVAGERYLRIVVMSPDTDERTLDELVHELRSPHAQLRRRRGKPARPIPHDETTREPSCPRAADVSITTLRDDREAASADAGGASRRSNSRLNTPVSMPLDGFIARASASPDNPPSGGQEQR